MDVGVLRVGEIHLSLAEHFDRRTSSPSPDILTSRWTFHCKMPLNIKLFGRHFKLFPGHLVVLDLLSPDISSSKVKSLGRTFFKICRTCPTSPTNFTYSVLRRCINSGVSSCMLCCSTLHLDILCCSSYVNTRPRQMTTCTYWYPL